ncbi:hypothetical protein R8Z50_29720 [Longispora sp. K20-0274]|uniref:hypothetical protein n=1 Tax=Longispora sp. K20-0274 TaxID=3088255 RepID=UPI003999CBDD
MRELRTNGWTMGIVVCGLAAVVIAAILVLPTLWPDPPRGLAGLDTTVTAYRTDSPEWQRFAASYGLMGGAPLTTPESDVVVVTLVWGKDGRHSVRPAMDSCDRPYSLPVPPGWQRRGFATTGDARETATTADRIDLALGGYPKGARAHVVFGVPPGTAIPTPTAPSTVRC